MKNLTLRLLVAAAVTLTTLASGCAVMRDQESVGAYVDDTAITSVIKAKYVEDKTVDASSISVETLKGVVQLSGFAKSAAEKNKAIEIARGVKGVTQVQDKMSIRP